MVLTVSIRGIMEEISLHSKTAHAGAAKTSSASGLHAGGQFDASVKEALRIGCEEVTCSARARK